MRRQRSIKEPTTDPTVFGPHPSYIFYNIMQENDSAVFEFRAGHKYTLARLSDKRPIGNQYSSDSWLFEWYSPGSNVWYSHRSWSPWFLRQSWRLKDESDWVLMKLLGGEHKKVTPKTKKEVVCTPED